MVTGRALLFAQKLAGFLVDEMQPGAGEAGHGNVGIGLVFRRGVRKPMLHVGAQLRAFEEDMAAHPVTMPGGRWPGHFRMIA